MKEKKMQSHIKSNTLLNEVQYCPSFSQNRLHLFSSQEGGMVRPKHY